MPVLYANVGGTWVPISATGPAAGRNLLDNGQMAIKQRAATTVALAGGTFLADRWIVYNNSVGAANLNYVPLSSFAAWTLTGRPRPTNVQYVVMTTAEAVGAHAAGDFMQYRQSIEGLFLQHLNWGTSEAQPLTYSFDIYSTLASTYIVTLHRPETTARFISRALSVPAGWSTQIVTFAGDTTGPVITNDSAARLFCSVWMEAGSQFTGGTLQTSWGTQAVDANMAAGLTNNFSGTINNAFALTNCQLEIGTLATPYEVRRYDDDFQHCLRYFYETAKGLYGSFPSTGVINTTTNATVSVQLPVRMRAVPTASYVGAVRVIDQYGAVAYAISALADATAGQSTADVLYLNATIAGAAASIGRYVTFQGNNDVNAAFRASAEI